MIKQDWKICTLPPTILVFKETEAIPGTLTRDCLRRKTSCSFLTLNPKALIKKPWGVRVSSTVNIVRKETYFWIINCFLGAFKSIHLYWSWEKAPTFAEKQKLPSQSWKWSSDCWIHGAPVRPDDILHIGTTLQNSSACKILHKRLSGEWWYKIGMKDRKNHK